MSTKLCGKSNIKTLHANGHNCMPRPASLATTAPTQQTSATASRQMEGTHPPEVQTTNQNDTTTLSGSTISCATIPADVLRKTDIGLVAKLQCIKSSKTKNMYPSFTRVPTASINVVVGRCTISNSGKGQRHPKCSPAFSIPRMLCNQHTGQA